MKRYLVKDCPIADATKTYGIGSIVTFEDGAVLDGVRKYLEPLSDEELGIGGRGEEKDPPEQEDTKGASAQARESGRFAAGKRK